MNSRRSAPPRTVVHRFLRMTLIFVPVVLCITLTVFLYAKRTIEAEFTSINLSNTRAAAEELKRMTRKMRFITASLLLDENARSFFTGSNVFEGTEKALNGQIKAYLNTYDGVESIFLYAPLSGRVLSGLASHEKLSALSDRGWADFVADAGGMLLQPRESPDGYPYVLTVMRRLNEYGYDGVAVVNIGLNELGAMLGVQEDDAHVFYVLDGDGRALYRRNKQALLEDASQFEDLRHFEPGRAQKTLLDREQGRAFVWSQACEPSTG